MATHCLSDKRMLRCGRQEGFRYTEQGLAVSSEAEPGLFVSRIYDSGREGTEWNHICLDIGRTAVLEVYVWIFDSMDEDAERLFKVDIRAWFKLQKGQAGYYSNYRNMLLYGHGAGRYARIAVKILPVRGMDSTFRGYDLSFPKESFDSYLPSIYRNNLSLERFLAVQQNIYLELEQSVDGLAEKMDYELCSRNHAVSLARWLGWGEMAYKVKREILKELLQAGVSLAGRKGTCDYYIRMTKILTGKRAVMLEEPERCRAVVLLLEKPERGREENLEWLKRNVPIGIQIDFIVLNKTDRLDMQYFLDRTACLSEDESLLMENGCPIECLRLL